MKSVGPSKGLSDAALTLVLSSTINGEAIKFKKLITRKRAILLLSFGAD